MFYFAVAVLCGIIAIIDIKTYRISDILLVFLLFSVLLPDKSYPPIHLTERLLTASLAFIFFGSVYYFTGGMGFGDVKYAFVLGYILGIGRIIPAFVFTAVFGIIIYVMGIFIFRWSKTTKIPFGPFLSAGAVLSLGIAA